MKPDLLRKINQKNPNKVTELRLENGKLKRLPFDLDKFKRLKFLNLYNNRLEKLPDYFGSFDKLENLNLSSNKFILFPETITNCISLKTLNIKGNRVTDLIGLEKLSNTLEKLDISNNNISVMRIDFSKFNKLHTIDLSDNKVIAFPKSLVSEKTKILNISSNKIKKLPPNIKKFEKLRVLDLSYNELVELPEEIGELTELRELNITGNKIITLPKSFKNLTKLNKLLITGNPIGEPPIEISNQGIKARLNYYLHYGVSVELNEAKLLIVGQGGVGKTYLVNKIINGYSPETLTTEGIDIFKWKFNIEDRGNNRSIKLNAWDFGGQEIYHSTHQFFLTKRSIYLFVWEARKDESSITFDYWLSIIQILSNSSPVIVVLNKIDERIKEIDEKSLKEKFPNIISFLKVSAKSGENIENLKKTIKQEVIRLPHIGDKLPEVWSQIREELEALTGNYITYDRYIEICNSFGLSKEDSKDLSRYFHDLGVFLHFNDNRILKPIVFLKADWVTNSVYKILDIHSIISNFGRFSFEIVENHLTQYNMQERLYIIELMKKFELCFEIEKDDFIVPELLSPNEPDVIININSEKSIGMNYKYDFMPAGLIPRLIVRLKEAIFDNIYWKNGVYVKHQDSIGLIIGNPYTRTISLIVSGSTKAILLGIIKRELDIINNSLNNPYHVIKIKCNCKSCSTSDLPYMFDFSFLERARLKLPAVFCQSSLEEVNINKLIGPYDIKYEDDKYDDRFNSETLVQHIYEISTRILERKFTYKLEDLITDNFTDQLRSIGYYANDQTRSGRAKKLSGELDIMIRDSRNKPISILEAMNLGTFGNGNNIIIEHLNKLLINYDTNKLNRNFMLIYSKSNDFSKFWTKYMDYIKNISSHEKYDNRAKIISHSEKSIGHSDNIKVLVTQHERNSYLSEVYHFIINLGE